MLRSQAYKILSLEQSAGAIFFRNNLKSIYTNTCHYMESTKNCFKATPATVTSKSEDRWPEHNENMSDLSEREFLVRLKSDPDKFGPQSEFEIEDEDDFKEEQFLSEQPLPSQRLTTKKYSDIIKGLIKKRKIKEAIDVLEVRMLKEDRVKPEAYIYNLLIGACGRVGYTKKAFMLYNNMKRRGLEAMGGTYTALFNACSNSPWPLTDGLTRAKHLREIMIEKRDEPNDTTYNAMIKAFGRCGDLQTAFFLVDEMASKGHKVTADTLTFLFQACITDKKAGFRHALLVWRKIIDRNLKPTVYNYNMLLRAIRDCGLGDIEITKDVISRITGSKQVEQLVKDSDDKSLLLTGSDTKVVDVNSEDSQEKSEIHTEEGEQLLKDSNDKSLLLTGSDTNTKVVDVNSENSQKKAEIHAEEGQQDCTTELENLPEDNATGFSEPETKDLRPNLMAKVPHLGSLIVLSEVKKPEDRLLLVGGFNSFLDNMEEHNCKPDIRTFTQLLDCIPGSLAAEQQLLAAFQKYNLEPDLDFYNMLMKKRSMRRDYEGAKVVLEMMEMNMFRPNVMTYGILAMGCKTKDQCVELIEDIKSKKYALNAEILGAMLHQACFYNDIRYIMHVMELCISETVNPNKMFFEKLDGFQKKFKQLYNEQKVTDRHWKLFKKFRDYHNTWKEQVHADESEDAHPWQQFRQPNDSDVNTAGLRDTTRFKARHASLFKVKTSTKRRY